MYTRELTPEQKQWLADTCAEWVRQVGLVRSHMDRRGIFPADEVRREVEDAYNAVFSLRITTMYMAMGKPPASPLGPPVCADVQGSDVYPKENRQPSQLPVPPHSGGHTLPHPTVPNPTRPGRTMPDHAVPQGVTGAMCQVRAPGKLSLLNPDSTAPAKCD